MSGFGIGAGAFADGMMRGYSFGTGVKRNKEQDAAREAISDYLAQFDNQAATGGFSPVEGPAATGVELPGQQTTGLPPQAGTMPGGAVAGLNPQMTPAANAAPAGLQIPGLASNQTGMNNPVRQAGPMDRETFLRGLVPHLAKLSPTAAVGAVNGLYDARARAEETAYQRSRDVESDRRWGMNFDLQQDELKYNRGRQAEADARARRAEGRADSAEARANAKHQADMTESVGKSLYYALASGDSDTASNLAAQNADLLGQSIGLEPHRKISGVDVVGDRVTFRIQNSKTQSEGPMTANGSADANDQVISMPISQLGYMSGAIKPSADANKPTNDAKQYQEMLNLGVPENVARGVAYGTIKSVKDQYGMESAFVDLGTGQVIGQLDKGAFQFAPGYASGAGGGGMSEKAAGERARAEASDRAGFWSSDESDFADYGGSRQQFISDRTMQLMGMQGVPQQGQAPQQQRAQGQAPREAVEYLRQNVSKNPGLKEAFQAKYGYLPEGI